MPRSALKLEFSFFCLCAGATSGYCAITVTQKVQSSCGYELQINEDNIALFGASGIAPGIPNSPCGCFDANPPKVCRVNLEDFYKNKIELGRQTFKNKQGETCFLDNLSLGYTEQGCFSGSCRSFSGLSFSVSCEPPASIPDKCGKSRAFAETVLLSDNAFKCDSLGGKFEGGVYPQKSPDGTDEYCVSGTCSNLCDSAWHRNVVKEIKDSVCCGRMKLEPQTGNGKCTEPKAMDSTKIGVHFPEVKLGCSVTPAGSGFNYCEVSSSSSSSSFDDVQSSSSYEDSESSSSGEGESDSEVDCFADVGKAVSNLHSKIRRCEQEGGVSDFREYSGCVYGSCLPPSSSSSEEMSSSSEDGDSSSSNLEEDVEYGDCPAPPAPFKPQSLMSPKELPLGGYYQHEQVLYNIKGQQVQAGAGGGSAVMEYLAREGLLENPEIYFEEELNIPFVLEKEGTPKSCGTLRSDYGIIENGRYKGGITCPQVVMLAKFEPNSGWTEEGRGKCKKGDVMYEIKNVTLEVFSKKTGIPIIKVVNIGFKFSDGYIFTREDSIRLYKHEKGHQKYMECLEPPSGTEATFSGCFCESDLTNRSSEALEKYNALYSDMLKESENAYHNKYGLDGFPEEYKCP